MTDHAASSVAGSAPWSWPPPRLLSGWLSAPLLVRRGGVAPSPLTAAMAIVLLLLVFGWPLLLLAAQGGGSREGLSALSLRSASGEPLSGRACACPVLCSNDTRGAYSRLRAQRDGLRDADGRLNESVHRRPYSFHCAHSNPCSARAGDLWAAIVVTSAASNAERREAIRSTWASEAAQLAMSVVFLTGLTTDALTLRAMAAESERYGDLVVGDFLDSYDLLTVKSVAMLRWAMGACPRAMYLVKVDDDMFVSLSHLQAVLQANAANRRSIIGNKRDHLRVVTSSRHKWRDPFYLKHYGKFYPPYMSGTTYVIAMSIVAELFRASQIEPFDRMEDVFITGICARRIGNVTHIRHLGFSASQRTECSFSHTSVVTGHHVTPLAMRSIWSKLSSHVCATVQSEGARQPKSSR